MRDITPSPAKLSSPEKSREGDDPKMQDRIPGRPNPVSATSGISEARKRVFILTALHAFPATLLVNGAPFYAKGAFKWDVGQIALTQTYAGAGVILGAYLGGIIAHRTRPRYALLLGMLVCFLTALLGVASAGERNATGFAVSLAIFAFGQGIVWPAIETALMEGQSSDRIQNFVGKFNLTWSLFTALAVFAVSPATHFLGLSALFSIPAIIYFFLILYVLFILPITPAPPNHASQTPHHATSPEQISQRLSPAVQNLFRWLGWLANPLSFIAVNAIIVYNPAITTRLHLSEATASIWLSLWFYVRIGSFEIFRRWTGWHYHWRLLCGVFFLTILSFAAIILSPNLFVLMTGQIVFGLSLGLLYQSSLFYSMAESDAQGEHGGLHECFVGVGLTLGTFIVFAGIRFFPSLPSFPILSVLAIMTVGLAGLFAIGKSTGR